MADTAGFDPNRWLQGDKSTALERYFMPNSCPGQNIARIEMSKVAATLVRACNIRQVDPKQDWRWKAYFTLSPHSWTCYIEKHSSGEDARALVARVSHPKH
ncbi:hypothetical protein B0H67DRAFT_640595 [Lasiosphaeris hirsuta]|uniref:Uncharacterized protein n=1 Tax=Lasiosphaeris hirsuta TaxID=260670 RepID=A0AA40E8L4_9PEZI|nr:hypothetical protein B0H67DRAFT_640595 [Lasiosphaeris hirsuta]